MLISSLHELTREWRKKKGKNIKEKKDKKHRTALKITFIPSQIGQAFPSSLLKNPKGMTFLGTPCSA